MYIIGFCKVVSVLGYYCKLIRKLNRKNKIIFMEVIKFICFVKEYITKCVTVRRDFRVSVFKKELYILDNVILTVGKD